MKNILLELKQLEIGYKKSQRIYTVQSDLNLSLKEGELICLIGPNGVGKSTLLKTFGKIIPCISGEIKIYGKDLESLSQKDFSQSIGLVLTENIDVIHLRAIDIISMGRYPYTGFWGKLGKKDMAIVEQVAEMVGISNLLSRFFHELSDGERQKVMIAKVLAQKTPLMLLDEPTAFLDFPTKSSLLHMLKKLAREQKIGVILSTHDIELALKTADQIWLFPEHQKIIHGMPEDLVLEGEILKVFQNSEMTFDLETGHFEKVLKPIKSIQVNGTGHSAFWLKKAFLRNDISYHESSDWEVKCDEDFQVYHHNDLKKRVKSIKEVLNYLKIQ